MSSGMLDKLLEFIDNKIIPLILIKFTWTGYANKTKSKTNNLDADGAREGQRKAKNSNSNGETGTP